MSAFVRSACRRVQEKYTLKTKTHILASFGDTHFFFWKLPIIKVAVLMCVQPTKQNQMATEKLTLTLPTKTPEVKHIATISYIKNSTFWVNS